METFAGADDARVRFLSRSEEKGLVLSDAVTTNVDGSTTAPTEVIISGPLVSLLVYSSEMNELYCHHHKLH